MTIIKKISNNIRYCRILCAGLLLLSASAAHSQETDWPTRIVQKYFRVDPFEGRFSSFVRAFKTDPDLVNKLLTDKTDSSLFVVRGEYTNFNPFDIRPQTVTAELAERAIPIDNSSLADTIVTYQIMAIFNTDTVTVKKRVEKEYRRIVSRIGKDIKSNAVLDLAGKNSITEGEVTNYFYPLSPLAAMTVSWFASNTKKTYLLIHIRLMHPFNNAQFVGMSVMRFQPDQP